MGLGSVRHPASRAPLAPLVNRRRQLRFPHNVTRCHRVSRRQCSIGDLNIAVSARAMPRVHPAKSKLSIG